MKKLLLLLFVVITIIAGASKSASAQVPLYIQDAFKKAALPADDKGEWIVSANVQITKPSGEIFIGAGNLALAGNDVLAGNLSLRPKGGFYIKGHTMWLIISKEAGPLVVMLRHDIAGKPFLGRPAVQAKLKTPSTAPFSTGTIMWDSEDSLVKITLSPEQHIAGTPGIRKPPPTQEWIFNANTRLKRDKRYYSEDKRYALVFQLDGNLVIYKFSAPEKFSPIWNTQTMGSYANQCVLQGDGNLVLYDGDKAAVWDSKSDAKNKKKKWYDIIPGTGSDPGVVGQVWMVMQNDGNLVIYTGLYPKGYALWSSGTFEKN